MVRTSFKIGDSLVHRIVDSEVPLVPALEFFPTLTAERLAEHRAWLLGHALDEQDRVLLCFQSYVVRTPHHTVLIDTCIGNHKTLYRPEWNNKTDTRYMDQLAAHGIDVADVDYVMCTHLHPDHVGWNTRLDNGIWVPTFPNARYVFAEAEHRLWSERHAQAEIPSYAESVLPIIAAGRADLVGEEYALGDHFRLLATPGHTAGHVAIRLGQNRDEAVFCGDLIHSPLQARMPELSSRFDMDPELAGQTRRGFLERYCDTATLCCTAHFTSPSVGRIKRWDDGFRCEMVAA